MKTKTITSLISAFLVLFFSCTNTTISAKETHKITVTIENFPAETESKMYYLARYFGDSHFKADSSKLINKKQLVFEGDSLLHESYYKVLLNDSTFFEIVVGKNQTFNVSTDFNNIFQTLTFENSPENTILLDYFQLIQSKTTEYREKEATLTTDEEKNNFYKKQLAEITNWRKEKSEKNPDFITSYTFRVLEETQLDFGDETDSNKQQEMYYDYLKNYLNTIDFSDSRTYNIPATLQKVNFFLETLQNTPKDTIIQLCSQLIEKNSSVRKNKQFILGHLLNRYGRGQFMGSRDIYAKLVLKHVNKESSPWFDDAQLYRLQDKATRLDKISLDAKAPTVFMKDADGKDFSTLNLTAKIKIYMIFSASCGHCKEAAPYLKKFYEDYGSIYNFQIVTMNTDDNQEEWGKFIEEQEFEDFINLQDFESNSSFRVDYYVESVPSFFIIDENFIIRAKGFPAEQLEDVYTTVILGKKAQ